MTSTRRTATSDNHKPGRKISPTAAWPSPPWVPMPGLLVVSHTPRSLPRHRESEGLGPVCLPQLTSRMTAS